MNPFLVTWRPKVQPLVPLVRLVWPRLPPLREDAEALFFGLVQWLGGLFPAQFV